MNRATHNPRLWRVRSLVVSLLATSLVMASCAPEPPPQDRVELRLKNQKASHVDVRYGSHAAQLLDIYPPTGGGNRGVIIAVHGGGFTTGSKEQIKNYFGLIMAQRAHGFGVVAVNYRLTKGSTNRFPTAVNDVGEAVTWVRAQGANYRLNPATVVVAGTSAGGAIAGLLATADVTTGPLSGLPDVDGWMSSAGVYDFADSARDVADARRAWLGTSDTAAVRSASVLHHLDAHDAPGYVLHGANDTVVPVRQAHELQRVARQRGWLMRLSIEIVPDEIVDRSTAIGIRCGWHFPHCAAKASSFTNWLKRLADDVARRPQPTPSTAATSTTSATTTTSTTVATTTSSTMVPDSTIPDSTIPGHVPGEASTD